MKSGLIGVLSALAIGGVLAAPAAAQPTGACVYQDFVFPFTPHCVDGVTEAACAQLIGGGGIGHWLGAGTTCDAQVYPEHPYTYDKDPLDIANAGQDNISGASLFVDFFGYPGTTNDCNDVDGDDLPCPPNAPFQDFVNGKCGVYGVDQMAPEFTCGNWSGHWLVQYRSVGSGNGLGEFVDYQLLGALPSSIPSERGIINRAIWANTGSKTWPCGANVEANCFPPAGTGDLNCDNKVDGADVQAMTAAIVGGQTAYLAAYPSCYFTRADYNEDTLVDLDDIPGLVNCMLAGGCGVAGESGSPICPQSVDVANMDVATKWFVQTGGSSTAGWNQKPTIPGYGYNPNTTVSVGAGTASNQLKNLVRGGMALNTNTANPDENTVFDTTLAFSPAGLIANRGAGLGGGTGNIKYTELQYLFVTGRMPSGENLTACTRDSGSGTRNLTMNCIGVDPSWGAGDNLGKKVDNDADAQIGAGKQPTNCGGSGVMETAVQNRRLAVGYTGIFGTSRIEGDVPVGKYELLNVLKDVAGATSFVRPDDINKLIDNADPNTGYQIGGSQTLATRGDPEAAANGNPPMESVAARDLILNITHSLQTWVSNPSDVRYACPAGVLVQYFMPDASVDALPILTDPTSLQTNPNFNANAQESVRSASTYQTGVIAGYGQWQPGTGGKVPKRVAGAYEDGSTNGNYRDLTGAYTVSSSGNVMGCMAIQGDWNGDGVRNADDIGIMMVAYWLKQNVSSYEFSARMAANDWATAYPALVACCSSLATQPFNGDSGNYIIPELFGDYDGDGNFTAEDIRYFADGLALNPISEKLDRQAAFTAVDTMWYCQTGDTDNNFFNTVIAVGDMTYNAGDSRFDVAGDAQGSARGAMPRGADGAVNAVDVTYVANNVFTSGQPWGTTVNHDGGILNDYLGDHASKDLSCDMNGDLIVNSADVAIVTGG